MMSKANGTVVNVLESITVPPVAERAIQLEQASKLIGVAINSELNERERAWFIAFHAGIESQVIAASYNVPSSTVRNSIDRSREKLRAFFELFGITSTAHVMQMN